MTRDEFLAALEASGYDVATGPPEARLLLEEALATIDEIERLRAELAAAPSTVVLSERGQAREHPALGALRAHRTSLSRLLETLFPKDETPTTVRARQAARTRWEATRR
jgi:hypothetical protein